jgi:hypothetical protein
MLLSVWIIDQRRPPGRRGAYLSVQAYLGHKNIQHTVRYTELAPDRFRNFWRS